MCVHRHTAKESVDFWYCWRHFWCRIVKDFAQSSRTNSVVQICQQNAQKTTFAMRLLRSSCIKLR